MKKILFTLCLTLFAVVFVANSAQAATPTNLQDQIDSDNQQITALNQKIATYEAALQQVGADKKTLQAAINALNLQRSEIETKISVTQHQIDSTGLQIKQLDAGITSTEESINTDKTALAEEIRNLKKIDDQSLLLEILSSNTISQAWNDTDTLLQIQRAIQANVASLKTKSAALADSQAASEQKQNMLISQKKSLSQQQQQLIATKQSKDQLLAQTKAKESNYQKLLADAKAQLASFSAFTQNAGGSKLLTNQTSCDSWGCYYNQRDAAWGNNALNGTQYHLASDGCLITAMAMVMTHYGHPSVTPVTINSNPGNFATYYPAYLLFSINVDGVTATRKTAAINNTLAGGDPVIVGLHAYGGTHFVVLVSKSSDGDYIMRDPYIPDGKDISFSDHYSIKNIYEVSKVTIQ